MDQRQMFIFVEHNALKLYKTVLLITCKIHILYARIISDSSLETIQIKYVL